MRQSIKISCVLAFAAVLAVSAAGVRAEAAGGSGAGVRTEGLSASGPGLKKEGAEKKDSFDISSLKTAEGTDQIVLVVGEEGCNVTVSFYEKAATGVWGQNFSVAGRYGRNGGSFDKREGDGKTPLGAYSFTMAFGAKENPESVIAYHQLRKGDYWVDDGKSRYYNQLVNTKTTKKDWTSAEDMLSIAPYYDYGLVLNYNPDCVPGKGSAIFLHCDKPKETVGSSGCVKIPEEYMKKLLQTVDGEAKIIIVSEPSQLKDF